MGDLDLKSFIKYMLKELKKDGNVQGRYTGWKDNVVIIKGTIKNGLADVDMGRIRNGHRCSGVSAFEMPLTAKAINNLLELVKESL